MFFGDSLCPFPVDDSNDVERVVDKDVVTFIVRMLEEKLARRWKDFVDNLEAEKMGKIGVDSV